jgi:Holliday junction resolvase RusA-like endonuclease
VIALSLPGLPPSANNAYFNVPRGGRALTKDGRAYKLRVVTHLTQHFRKEMLFFKKNTPYVLFVRFFFADVENKTYPAVAQTRFKKVDGSNRLKLLEDALKDAAGIDDSQAIVTCWHKAQGTPERTLVWVWDLEAEATPLAVLDTL